MEDSCKDSIQEIKKNINKLRASSNFRFLTFIICGVVIVTLIIIYVVLKLKNSADSYEVYEEYFDDDSDVYPFDEEELEEELNEAGK